MQRSLRFVLAVLLPCVAVVALAAQPKTADSQKDDKAKPETVAAVVESSLATGSGQVRQFAFDGNPDTYFASEKNATKDDHLTLTFDRAVAVKSVKVTTGKPKGGDQLDAGVLEASEDGKKFEELAKFADGEAGAKPDGKRIKALRVRPSEDLKHPLAVREFAVESDPAVLTFKYPVEYVIDVSAAPEMKEWAEKAARTCERHYGMICEELKSDGFKPRTVITMTLSNSYNGVAATSGARITGSSKYFKEHPADFGAMVHETVHCVQNYRGRGNPGWLVEGVADWYRFFKYEPGKLPRLTPERARYNGSYKVSAAFLAFAAEKYDRELVRKLNKAMREGQYRDELFKDLTGKTLEELNQEWRASLAR